MRRDKNRVRALNCLLSDDFNFRREFKGNPHENKIGERYNADDYIDWKKVSEATDADLLRISGLGYRSLRYIHKVLWEKGLRTIPEPEKPKPQHYERLGRIDCPHCGEHINLHTYHHK